MATRTAGNVSPTDMFLFLVPIGKPAQPICNAFGTDIKLKNICSMMCTAKNLSISCSCTDITDNTHIYIYMYTYVHTHTHTRYVYFKYMGEFERDLYMPKSLATH